MTFSEKVLQFYKTLRINTTLPVGVEVMNPYQNDVAFGTCTKFYTQFYNDNNSRTLILGINPGRFGGGITGVPFTDPLKLQQYCNIQNDLQKKAELSADFIYAMINAYGGVVSFYRQFYISAISPLGFVKDGKNLNYYDIKELTQAVEPFMVQSIKIQLSFGLKDDVCFCLGEGENFKYLKKLNSYHHFFKHIEPLPHPRFIMQYKRKKIQTYIDLYLSKLSF